MRRALIGAGVIAGLLAVLLAGATAAANDGPSNFIYEAAQSGQDVHLTLGVLHQDTTISLFREGPDYRKALFKEQDLVDALAPEAYCWSPGIGDECAGADSPCFDCDGDGEPECYEFCEEVYFVHYVDECVYPGPTSYYLYVGENYKDDFDYYSSAESLVVEDTGAECDYGLGGDEGCSTSGLGAGPSAGCALTLLLVGFGLLAVSRARRS